MDESTKQKIASAIEANTVMLFMKGTPDFPQCGFSAAVVEVLNGLDVPYGSMNVLADNAIREGIKLYSNWPTIPQLYVGGKFIGGADITRQMHASGELKPLIDAALGK